MSEIPEIEALELTVVQADTLTGERWTGEMVRWSDAEAAVRSAVDRQAREIEAHVRSVADGVLTDHPGPVGETVAESLRVIADRVSRFAPKEADPHGTR